MDGRLVPIDHRHAFGADVRDARMTTVTALLAWIAAGAAAAAPAADRSGAPVWRDGRLDDGETCFISRDYPRSALLVVLAHRSGGLWMAAGGRNWPLEEGRPYALAYRLGAAPAQSLQAWPVRSAGRRGFAVPVDAAFMRRLAEGGTLRLSYGDSGKAGFDLAGAGGAVGRLRACLARVRAAPISGAATRGTFLTDPFRRGAAFPRRALLPSAAWPIGRDDYPAAALRAEEQGLSSYRAEIGPNGRVVSCTIVGSSGSGSLDGATCRLLKSRARFLPALNARGRAIADVYYSAVFWRLPDE
ncbi:MAG TPA: energy transducer TonB [Allosphingosinicella sp.]